MRFWTLTLIIALLVTAATPTTAQTGPYCGEKISGMSWSPDGQRLAVMTLQGAFIYDHDLNLERTFEAPTADFHSPSLNKPIWSPDGVWMVLPQRTSIEVAKQLQGSWSFANSQTGEIRLFSSLSGYTRELVWSPDSRFMLSLNYDSDVGLSVPYTSLSRVRGILDSGYSPVNRLYDEIHLSNIRWKDQDILIAQVEGMILAFDP